MNPYVRERIQRKLDTLSEERLYQVLDYVEFLEAKYAERASSPVGLLRSLAETVEDKMRSGGVAVGTITETMGFLNRAVNVVQNVAQSTKNVASDFVDAASRAANQVGAPPPSTTPAIPSPNGTASTPPPAAPGPPVPPAAPEGTA